MCMFLLKNAFITFVQWGDKHHFVLPPPTKLLKKTQKFFLL